MMTFATARTLKVGDRITHQDTKETEFGTITKIARGVWTVRWTRNSGLGARTEQIPMGCVSKLEPVETTAKHRCEVAGCKNEQKWAAYKLWKGHSVSVIYVCDEHKPDPEKRPESLRHLPSFYRVEPLQ
jgi:restriction endonuclease Mrr